MIETRQKDIDKKAKTKEFMFSILGFILSGWIAHNIFTAYEWEISSFFQTLLEKTANFFSVIFLGENSYIKDLNFSWWVLSFCLACYGSIYSGIRVLVVFGDLFPHGPTHVKRDKGNVKSRILADYSTYQEFCENFEGFDQLSEKAKDEVKSWFWWKF